MSKKPSEYKDPMDIIKIINLLQKVVRDNYMDIVIKWEMGEKAKEWFNSLGDREISTNS